MLTAICGPFLFNLQWGKLYLLSLLAAIGRVLFTRNTLLSLLLSRAISFLLRGWL
jgi:branched-subunit amino acid transport protein